MGQTGQPARSSLLSMQGCRPTLPGCANTHGRSYRPSSEHAQHMGPVGSLHHLWMCCMTTTALLICMHAERRPHHQHMSCPPAASRLPVCTSFCMSSCLSICPPAWQLPTAGPPFKEQQQLTGRAFVAALKLRGIQAGLNFPLRNYLDEVQALQLVRAQLQSSHLLCPLTQLHSSHSTDIHSRWLHCVLGCSCPPPQLLPSCHLWFPIAGINSATALGRWSACHLV